MLIKDYLSYPVRLEAEAEGGFSVFVRLEDRELPTQAETEDEAKQMALSALIDWASAFAGKAPIAKAGIAQEGDIMIYVPMDLALKFMLRNAMLEERWRIADLARKMNCTPQRLFKVVDFGRASKLELLAQVFEAIGRPLQISC